ncbi:MarR family transcriptional regulator [Bacillus carboniphilus]|uniref:MarR family transcriptional regulator n=1 Tax=Bacillus carboniphilus TaxID=86663 RepID=A0ABN0W6X3_9BACI
MEDHRLFHGIHQLSRLLHKHLNITLQPYGLYSAQWSVLYVLRTKGTSTQSELCEYLAVEAPPMTRLIQRLVKQGYVSQVTSERDKRVKYIQLSEKAIKEFPIWEKAVLDMNESLVRNFPEDSQEKLAALIKNWLTQLEK